MCITARLPQVCSNALDWDEDTTSISALHPSVSARKVGKAEDRYLGSSCRSVSYRGIAIHSLRQTKVNREEIGKWRVSWGTQFFFRKVPIS